jgi:hypothetical protein
MTMSTDAGGPVEVRSNAQLGPTAWAVMAFGRLQKLVMRADVADELTCKWRESDPEATAVPLYSWATVEAERQRWERALKQTWQAIDPLKPAGQPGSYARGYDNGFAAALEVLRGNLGA